MALFGLFSKQKESEDYEEVLQSLHLDIQKRQQRLADIKLRERRTTLLITLYTFAAWVAYIGAWYAGWRPLGSAPLIVGPLVIQFARRISQWWYTRIGDAEEKTLKDLLTKQRSKIEEIKKKTGFYSTKSLLERYDGPAMMSPRPRGAISQPSGQGQGVPQTPQRTAAPGMPNGKPQTPMQNRAQPTPQPQSSEPSVPIQRQWYDRLVDAILGEEEGSNASKNQYALICQKCFTHNGLVKEEQWMDTQYICMKCNYFNPSMRSVNTGQGVMSPPRVVAPLSQEPSSAQRKAAPRKSAPPGASGALIDFESPGFRRSSLPEHTPLSDSEEDEKKARQSKRAVNEDAIDALLGSDDAASEASSPVRSRTREVEMEVESNINARALTSSRSSANYRQHILRTAFSGGTLDGKQPKLFAVMEL